MISAVNVKCWIHHTSKSLGLLSKQLWAVHKNGSTGIFTARQLQNAFEWFWGGNYESCTDDTRSSINEPPSKLSILAHISHTEVCTPSTTWVMVSKVYWKSRSLVDSKVPPKIPLKGRILRERWTGTSPLFQLRLGFGGSQLRKSPAANWEGHPALYTKLP